METKRCTKVRRDQAGPDLQGVVILPGHLASPRAWGPPELPQMFKFRACRTRGSTERDALDAFRPSSAGSAFDLVGKRVEVSTRDDSDRSIAS